MPATNEATPLDSIFLQIAHRTSTCRTVQPAWPCSKGCAACCRRLANPPEVTQAEWRLMETGFRQLSRPEQSQIADRIKAMAAGRRNADGFHTCPFLNREQDICLLYDYRPAACRLYGFYVARGHNQWCADIQSLYDQGELNGVVLGNATAINRQLGQHYGPSQPVMEWFLNSEIKNDA